MIMPRSSVGIRMAAAVAILTVPPSTAFAHHSFAMFDNSREVVLEGSVTEYRWTNPHGRIVLTVVEKGQPVQYAIETPSPNDLSRAGWTSTSLKAGDRAKITIHPLRDGSKGGSLVRGVLPDGRTLSLAN